jgi:hypothetical protein
MIAPADRLGRLVILRSTSQRRCRSAVRAMSLGRPTCRAISGHSEVSTIGRSARPGNSIATQLAELTMRAFSSLQKRGNPDLEPARKRQACGWWRQGL